MQRSRKAILIASGLAIFASASAALLYSGLRRGDLAGASPAPELLSELPVGASALIYADLNAIRASTFYQQRPDRGRLTMPNRDYADFMQATGFDFEKDLDRVVVATWSPDASQTKTQAKQDQTKMVVLAEGRFDRKKIHDYALQKGKLDHQNGREVYLFSNDKMPGWNSFTFLDDHHVAIVAGPSIAPLLDQQSGASTPDPARERAMREIGAAAFVVTRVPPVPDNFSPGGIQSAQLLSLARSVQWVTLAARPEGNDLRVSLEGECQTATDARQLQAALEVFRMFGTAGLESSKARKSMDPATFDVLETILKTADVKQTDARVRILVELTPDIFKLSGPRKVQ